MKENKKVKWGIAIGLLVLSFLLVCWPGIVLFNRPKPIIWGMAPVVFWVCVVITLMVVGFMCFLYKWGLEDD